MPAYQHLKACIGRAIKINLENLLISGKSKQKAIK
jgi:hypothetical protein